MELKELRPSGHRWAELWDHGQVPCHLHRLCSLSPSCSSATPTPNCYYLTNSVALTKGEAVGRPASLKVFLTAPSERW